MVISFLAGTFTSRQCAYYPSQCLPTGFNKPTTRPTKICCFNGFPNHYDLRSTLNDVYQIASFSIPSLPHVFHLSSLSLPHYLSLAFLTLFHSHLQGPTRSAPHQHKLIANINQPHATHYLFDYLRIALLGAGCVLISSDLFFFSYTCPTDSIFHIFHVISSICLIIFPYINLSPQ